MQSKTILIAGGTGLIGNKLVSFLRNKGHEVRILTRKKTQITKGLYHWSPNKKEIDLSVLNNVSVIINLVGTGIADKRWTKKRKQEIIDSRVIPARFLAAVFQKSKTLEQYITASGINCYDLSQKEKTHVEADAYGNDFVSEVVKSWEESAAVFNERVKVTMVRTAVVLTSEGGALPKIAKPIKYGVGAPLGSGKQWIPWITRTDLIRVFEYLLDNSIAGTFNTLAENTTNKDFTRALANNLKKPLWLPHVPAFVLKIMLGEMSQLVLEGVKADNSALKKTGFEFNHKNLSDAFKHIYEENELLK